MKLLAVLLGSAAATANAKPLFPSPFFEDPLFNGAHDAEFIWHEGEQAWWISYLQIRFNSPLSDPNDCHGCFYQYTDLGLASTPDNGSTWIYRGVWQGLGQPAAWGNASFGMRQNGSAFGGASWWRPAVVYNPDDKLYHGFPTYLLQRRRITPEDIKLPDNQKQYHVTHYSSPDLVHWNFQGFVGCPGCNYNVSRYDSAVFRIKDGRWIMVSARAVPGKRVAPPNLESVDMKTWKAVKDPALKSVQSGEGPHATRWKGKLWFNWEPACGDGGSKKCSPNVLRSDDDGLTYKMQPANLFAGNNMSTRYLDGVKASQGPVIAQGANAVVLYHAIVNYATKWSDLIGQRRTVLQVAPVVEDADGWLHADHTKSPGAALIPPGPASDRGPVVPRTQPLVWHVKAEDAMIIALAEMNRWLPRWCADEDASHELVIGYKLENKPFCQRWERDAAGCVDACSSNTSCAGVIAVATSRALPGVVSCDGEVLGDVAPSEDAMTNCQYINQTSLDIESGVQTLARNTSSWVRNGILTSTVQPWRDQTKVKKYFDALHAHTGADPYGWVWVLTTSARLRHRLTQDPLRFVFRVAGNGTILSMANASTTPPTELAPLMQFVRDP
jgi:hypothetical protein